MSSLQDKMYNYEVTPPPNTWDKIAIDLNEAELTNKFPGRLYNMDATPPADVWEKVNASLDSGSEPRIIPLSGKRSPLLRYAAAAILIGAIAFGIVKLTVNNDNKENNTAEIRVAKDSSESGKDKTTKETQTTNSNTDEDDAALEQSKDMVAKLDRPVKRIARKLNAYVARNEISYADNSDAELAQSIYAYEDHVPNLADRYVMLMTPDGNIIRMSKKWSDLLCCVSGEEQDADCKDQLRKWQQKIATSSLAPSPGNFMDILGLVNSLNESTEL